MALTDLLNRVKQSRLGQAVSNLDRDREKPGFQLFSPQTRRNVSSVLNDSKRGYQQTYDRFVAPRVDNVRQSFRDDPGQYSFTRAFSNIVPATKTALSPILGQQTASDVAYGLRGATQYTPFQAINSLGIDKRGQQNYQRSAPTTDREKTAQQIGRSTYGLALTAPLGGPNMLVNAGKRALTYTAGGGALGAGINKITGGDVLEGARQGALSGYSFAPLGAITNPITEKALGAVGSGGFLANQLSQRTVAGIANVIEDEIQGKIDGYDTDTQSRIMSFVIAASLTANDQVLKEARKQLGSLGIKNPDNLIKKAKTRIASDPSATYIMGEDGRFAGSRKRSTTLSEPRKLETGSTIQEVGDKYRITSRGDVSGKSTTKDFDNETIARALKNDYEGVSAQKRKKINEARFLLGLDRDGTNETAMGALAGIEPYQDEDGNWKIRYSPEKGLIGVAGLVGGKKAMQYADSPKFSSRLDQKPRFEIDDSQMLFKPAAKNWKRGRIFTDDLENIIDHPELFKNYPKLRKAKVEFVSDPNVSKGGNYNPSTNTIQVNTRGDNFKDHSTLLHEIQHAIQEIEGFARGGNPESANGLLRQANLEKTGKLNKQLQEYREKNWDVLSKYRKDLDELNRNPEVRRLLRLADEASNKRDFKSSEKYLAEANKYDVPSPPERIKELELVREIQKLERERGRILDFMGGDSYKRLSGELEARAVQRRMDLPQDQRLRVDPYADEAIATTGKADPNDFITRFDSGRSMSEADPTEALKAEARKYKSAEEFIKNIDRGKLEVFKQQKIDAGEKFSFSDFTPQEFKSKQEWAEKVFKPTLTDIYNQAKVDQPGPLRTNQQTPTVKTSTQNRPIAEISDKQVKQEAISELRRTESRQRYTDKVPYSLEDSVAHLPNMTSDNALKHKVTFLDYFRTPDRVLEKIGLGTQAKELRNAQQNYSQRLPKEIDKVTQWYERVGRSDDASKRIFQYLDGQKGVRLRPEEKQVANEMKQYLSSWADELGLPKDKRIANYITHIFENDFINKEFDPELEKIIADKVPGSVYDPFLQKRLGKQGYVEDAFRAMDAYVKRATRKSSMDPALESLKKASDKLPLQSWNYIKNYADRVNLRPTDIDNLFDTFIKQSPIGGRLGQRPVANVTRKVRNATYRGTLGLNVGSALRNLTQGANTYSQLGERYTARGYFDALRAIFGKSDELDRVGVTADSFIQDRNLSSKKQLLQKFDQGLWFMFDMAEKVNRGAAYFGAKARALSKGKSMQEAIDEGIDMARKTQFTFGAVDTPVALQGDIAKTLLQFQSYNIKQLEFLGELVSEKNVAGIVRYLGAWALFASVAGDVMGMDIKDAIPFSSEITEGKTRIGQTPAIKAVTGTYKALLNAPGQYGDDPKDTLIGRLKQQDVPEQLGAAFIPGFVQGKKTFEGIKTARQGYSESTGGRVRTPVEQTTSNLIKGALFGQYSNKQVREYFDENRTVLGEQQTANFKKILDSKGMQAASEYYNSVIQQREIDRNIEDIKSGIKTSNPDTDKITTKQAVDLIKAEIEAGVDVSETDLYTAYLNKEIKMPQSNRYEKSQRDSKLWSKAGTIIDDEDLSDAQKQVLKEKIASELGRPVEDLETYQVAKQNNDSKTLYAYDQIDTFKTNDEFMRFLVQGRKPINGEIIIADGVITNLVNDGIISEQLGKELKNLDLNEDGTVKKKKKKSGGSSKTRTAYNNYFKALAKVGSNSGRTKIKGVKVGDINFSLGL